MPTDWAPWPGNSSAAPALTGPVARAVRAPAACGPWRPRQGPRAHDRYRRTDRHGDQAWAGGIAGRGPAATASGPDGAGDCPAWRGSSSSLEQQAWVSFHEPPAFSRQLWGPRLTANH